MVKIKNKKKHNGVNGTNAKLLTFDENKNLHDITLDDKLQMDDICVDSIVSIDSRMEFEGSPVVEILKESYYKMMTYTKLTNEEISGIGYVERISSNRFRITDIFLPKQIVSKAQCECDISDQDAIMKKLIEEGRNPGNLKMWWHSHNTMGTSWSSTDEDTAAKSACDYFISIIVNHNMDLRCRLNIYQPIEMVIDNIKVLMIDSCPVNNLLDICKEEVRLKVKTEGYGYNRTIKGFGGNRGFNEDRDFDYGNNVYREREARTVDDIINKPLLRTFIYEHVGEVRQINNEETYEAPYGDTLIIGKYKLEWNESEFEYNVTDTKDRMKLTDDAVRALGKEFFEIVKPYVSFYINTSKKEEKNGG